ncbi:DUF3284 domain-containing protein [Catenisphaera adipataccumulans]|uniref:DUF3284 domain-containing protein n=1 Tax=Catenisphaera adipataccumulans TaxID=700500 RepID=A0A7W8CZS8_9FIRM|nr:DUF3284 domain-containing protein [Catenisphaera adipataccumulans]MBB5183362.1 hypothetical protein [Catenisphaera adipataccumulans]
MQVKMRVNVSAEAFYHVLVQSAMDEIKQVTGRTVDEARLTKGMTYRKKSAGRSIKVKIGKLVPNRKYTAIFVTVFSRLTFTYAFEPIDDRSCTITYTQDYLGPGSMDEREAAKQVRKTIRDAEKRIRKKQSGK